MFLNRALSVMIILSFGGTLSLAGTPWEEYITRPVSERAKAVPGIEYASAASREQRIDADLAILETQVLAGDREAVDLAFRLLAKADGHPAEALGVVLGRLVRVDPTLFLEMLKAHRALVARLDALLGGLGTPYLDREEARQHELQCRRESLRGVENGELKAIREECLGLLQGMLAETKAGF